MSQSGWVRVLIVDDSATCRAALRAALEADGIVVVGEVARGKDVLDTVRALKPDLVTMDVYLGSANGLDVTAQLMRECAVPILVVTGAPVSDSALAFRAIEAGALDICSKLPPARSPSYEPRRWQLVSLVKTLARVPVVHRRLPKRKECQEDRLALRTETSARARCGACGLLAVGASTGGPAVLDDLLAALPAPLPVPIALVQHLSEGFHAGFAEWLEARCHRRVVIVEQAEALAAGTVFLAPNDRHLELVSASTIGVSDAPARRYERPSVDVLFESCARVIGSNVVAVLLTGMGCDGAEGLLELRQSGAVTIVQAPASCAVDSMPRHGIDLGAAQFVLTPADIPDVVARYLKPDGAAHASLS